ncbi:MAG: hypothetical protein ACT4PL_03510 [Phycisphaerales bacterium]
MPSDFGALCADFYVNQRLELKMDLPSERETLLNMFDRMRKQFPEMKRFRRSNAELALESEMKSGHQSWMSLRRTSIRTGVVNPPSTKDAYAVHKGALELAPYFLALSPLDVEYLELVYGFDLLSSGNHDQIVCETLFAGSPLAALVSIKGASPSDCQPVIGISIPDADGAELLASFQVKTRPPVGRAHGGRVWTPDKDAGDKPDVQPEPLTIFLTIRRDGPIDDIAQLPAVFKSLTTTGERLLETKVIPQLILPLRDAIASGNS